MNKKPKYTQEDAQKVPRFIGIKTFMRLPYLKTLEDIDYAIIGMPYDTSANYRPGARFGPASIREISALLRPYNVSLGVNIMEELSGVDFGDVNCIPEQYEQSYKNIYDTLLPLAERNIIPIGLGGDHSIPLPELRALAKVYGPLALVHFDAHVDTWDDFLGGKYNHGTAIKRAYEEGLIDTEHCITVGPRGTMYYGDDTKFSTEIGIKVLTADKVREIGLPETIRQIRERVGNKKTFLTFDIDFIDPASAPGTGVYEIGGFNGHEALTILNGLGGIDFVGFDIAEVAPPYDVSQITAFLAATIVHTYLGLIAFNKKGK